MGINRRLQLRGAGCFQPLDRLDHSAHAEHPDGLVCHQLQPDGYRHHPFYRPGQVGHPAPNRPPDTPDAGDEYPPAQDQGNPGPLRPRPRSRIPRDHAPLSRSGRESHRMPGAVGRPDPHSLWPLSHPGPDPLHQARRSGRIVREDLRRLAVLLHFFLCPPGPQVPLVGPIRTRPPGTSYSLARVRYYLGPAENDHDPVHRPPPAGQPDHDAVDDAVDDCVLFAAVPQRPRPVLDCLQRHRHRHSILYNRVDSYFPAVPQGGAGS